MKEKNPHKPSKAKEVETADLTRPVEESVVRRPKA